MQAPRPARRHAARSVARATSGGRRATPARGGDAGVEEEEGAERGADELPAQQPGRGVADHVGRVADRLDRLPGRDRTRLGVPAEDRRHDEGGRDRTRERAHQHEDEDRFHRAPMPRAGGGRETLSRRAMRAANAMIETCGFTPTQVGKRLASATWRPETPRTAPQLSVTPRPRSPPTRPVPMASNPARWPAARPRRPSRPAAASARRPTRPSLSAVPAPGSAAALTPGTGFVASIMTPCESWSRSTR